MLRNTLLSFIESIVVLVAGSISAFILVKDYGIRVWRNNTMRKWVFDVIDRTNALLRGFANHLEAVETQLQCRIVYARISQPMKDHYRELTRNRMR
jgi:50S ribosomal subunit-associated GTPase HflX